MFSLSLRDVRLGHNGITEIQEHPFFQDTPWMWENIRQAEVPELKGDMGLQYPDVSDRIGDTDFLAATEVS